MPRKTTKSLVRPISPDRVYNSVLVQKVINRVMLNGDKQKPKSLFTTVFKKLLTN
jgi:small subunit ribosomal protein S7